MIKINEVTKSFAAGEEAVIALQNVSLEIADGECLVISGENGSGKSVLMSLLAGLDEPDAGTIVGGGRQVGLIFQEAETQILGETPREDIAFGPKNLGLDKKRVEAAVQLSLEQTGLLEKADFPARFLSGGEKRRLAVACMLALDRPVIVLDEPYANLDYGGVKQVNLLLKELKAVGKTIIILTHEIEKCLGLADRFVVLFRGRKVFEGPAAAALATDLEQWNIKNPLTAYSRLEDLVW